MLGNDDSLPSKSLRGKIHPLYFFSVNLYNLVNISYTGILSGDLGVHIGVYQPWYSQSLFINSRYYYDEFSCVNI